MKLLCIGDIALGDNASQRMWNPPGGVSPDEEIKVLFNWELPIGTKINPIPRSSGPRLLAHPDSLRVLGRWSGGFATLATNHIFDAGTEGLINTMDLLNQAGFATLGAGRTREEIKEPLLWETTNGTLGVVNWVFPETHPDWMGVPGPNCWPGLEEAKRTIHHLKSQTDWVLIQVHWSDELFSYPRPEDRALACELSKMGADLIIGHHPHVVRGTEGIGSCPVFYSLGNFYFSDFSDAHGEWINREARRNREGLGVLVTFRRGMRPVYELLSFWNTKREVVPDRLRRASRRVRSTSIPLQKYRTDAYVAWYKAQRSRFDRWDSRWHFGMMQRGVIGTLRRVITKLRNPSPESG